MSRARRCAFDEAKLRARVCAIRKTSVFDQSETRRPRIRHPRTDLTLSRRPSCFTPSFGDFMIVEAQAL